MATQSIGGHSEAQLAPDIGNEPASEVPSNSSPDLNVDSREGLDRHSDQAMSHDPALEENPQQEDQNQRAANEEGNNDLLGLSFPRKLWMVVEDEAFKSVNWSEDGHTVIIEVDLFEREILHRSGAEKIFETDSLKGFIRQLNLYGFSKIRPNDSEVHSRGGSRMMIYRNANFQRGKPERLENIWRKGDPRNPARQVTCVPNQSTNPGQQAACAPTPKKKKLLPTRRSPRFHKPEKGNENFQREAPNDQGPRVSQPLMSSGTCAMRSVSPRPLVNSPRQEPSGPSGEGTSENTQFSPLAAARMAGAGEVPSHPSGYPDYGAVVSLYNTCYSMLLAALSAMAPRNPPNAEEEESSDHKCAVCENLKDNSSS